MKKITLVILLLTMILPTGLAEDNNGIEVQLPELDIIFTLPDGFGENIQDPSSSETAVFRSVHSVAGYEFYVSPAETDEKNMAILLRKVKDESNGWIWEERVYGDHKFLMWRSDLFPGWWNAIIMLEDHYGPQMGLTFSELIDDPYPLAEEILTSVRFLSDADSE